MSEDLKGEALEAKYAFSEQELKDFAVQKENKKAVETLKEETRSNLSNAVLASDSVVNGIGTSPIHLVLNSVWAVSTGWAVMLLVMIALFVDHILGQVDKINPDYLELAKVTLLPFGRKVEANGSIFESPIRQKIYLILVGIPTTVGYVFTIVQLTLAVALFAPLAIVNILGLIKVMGIVLFPFNKKLA